MTKPLTAKANIIPTDTNLGQQDGKETGANRTPPEGIYGPRGWTTKRAIGSIIQPYVTSLEVPADEPLLEIPSFLVFAGMGAAAAERLLSNLTRPNLRDRQNLGPRCDELLKIAVANPINVRLHGYAVGPSRHDERLTIEGLWVAGYDEYQVNADHDDSCDCEILWDAISSDLGISTAFCEPDEIWPMFPMWEPYRMGWWLWWD
ncbi:MAG: hypothetical protein Q4P06_01775 [Actinomycetaceae bacterium]|nr:hypothetical protein [Actinomycetaceae bacterium]